MRARTLRPALAALAVAGALGHLAYWYLPRERPAAPSVPARALLAEAGSEAAAWIPFPHQNLARLERRTGALGPWLGGVLGRETGEAPPLPRFGPFPVPPADELVVVARRDGGVRAELAAYPAVAALARAAGALARNPWLAGGEVELGRGRRGRVRWIGRTWSLEAGAPVPASGPGAGGPALVPPPAGDTLALVRLGHEIGPLPAGLYRVERDPGSGELEIVAGAPPGERGLPVSAGAEGVPAPAGWWAETGAPGAARAFVVWDFDGDVPGLPALSALDRGGVRPFRLPTESLARLVGRDLVEGGAGGFRIRALERAAAERSASLARALEARFFGAGARIPPPAALAAARPGPLGRRARGLERMLGAVPVLGPESASPFARLALALAPLEGCALATLEIGGGGSYARLIPCSAGVLPGGRSD